jgi:hypothetical protein
MNPPDSEASTLRKAGRKTSTCRSRKAGGKYIQTILNATEYDHFLKQLHPGETPSQGARRLLFKAMDLPPQGFRPAPVTKAP